jgi:hypothetical protein
MVVTTRNLSVGGNAREAAEYASWLRKTRANHVCMKMFNVCYDIWHERVMSVVTVTLRVHWLPPTNFL